ncbi:MAG: type II secretion system F family protein [Armatimonadota bacterium]|jgi:type II secretory ATPase GspE/PulE/Tfp pilus assembly ATPase PilB-like protein
MDQRRVDRAVMALWCRELGALLRLGVPVLGALEVVAQEIEPLAAVTVELQASVQAGDALGRRIAEFSDVFPPLLRAAALAGEANGRLAEALCAVAECLQQSASLNIPRTSRERLAELAEQAAPAPAVAVSRRLINRAIEMGARRIRLTGGLEGGIAEVEMGGRWQTLDEIDRALFAPLCRRVKLMADIPYWIAEPAVGTIQLSTGEQGDWNVAVQALPEDDGICQHIEMTLMPR